MCVRKIINTVMKPDISKKILTYLIIAGAISIAATSPYFLTRLIKLISKEQKHKKDYQKFRGAFYYLKSKGLITVEKNKHDIVIYPTDKGAKLMKKYQILEMEIDRPKRWDGKIRVVAFDIPNAQRMKRNAFRYKLKELGFYSSQKSVWLHPFDCRKEIQILKEFFGLNNKQVYFFIAEKIEDTQLLEKIKRVYKI